MSDGILTVENKKSILDQVVNNGQIMEEMSGVIRTYCSSVRQYAYRF